MTPESPRAPAESKDERPRERPRADNGCQPGEADDASRFATEYFPISPWASPKPACEGAAPLTATPIRPRRAPQAPAVQGSDSGGRQAGAPREVDRVPPRGARSRPRSECPDDIFLGASTARALREMLACRAQLFSLSSPCRRSLLTFRARGCGFSQSSPICAFRWVARTCGHPSLWLRAFFHQLPLRRVASVRRCSRAKSRQRMTIIPSLSSARLRAARRCAGRAAPTRPR